jgi:hypothetical protein
MSAVTDLFEGEILFFRGGGCRPSGGLRGFRLSGVAAGVVVIVLLRRHRREELG